MTAEVPQPLTERARRSFSGRAAPFVVLALGLLFVVGAAYRLDAIYGRDAGIFRSSQLAPGPLAFAHSALVPVFDDVRNRFAETHFGHRICNRVHIDALCESRPVPPSSDSLRKALERDARRLYSRGSKDVSVNGWQERPGTIVATVVARFGRGGAARRALEASRRHRSGTAARLHVMRTAWLEGNRVLVGMLVSAPTRADAAQQLRASRRDVRAYTETSRILWYELLALGPLLLFFAVFFSARALAILAFALVFAIAALVAVAALLVYIPIAIVRARRRKARRSTRLPLLGGPIATTALRVESLDGQIRMLATENQSVMLALVGLVGFGIAMLTTSLFPASLAWGSLTVVALYTPTGVKSKRAARWVERGRTAVRILLGLTVVGLIFGLAPIGLLTDLWFQLVVVAGATLILVAQWRRLVTETTVDYARWYEDIDVRSTLFLGGVGLLTIGAASLFLASTGDPVVSSHVAEKAIGLVGLFVASTAAVNTRAARDSAARERARRRKLQHVLYLRSFGDDKLRVVSPRLERRGLERLSWRRTELFEDVVARSLSTIGPVVAIARPGTGQRDLGAARDSIVVDDWLTAVKSYMNEALLVAVVMGTSEGLARELETLGELRLLDRVCIIVPPLEDVEVEERMRVLEGQASFAEMWGAQPEATAWHVHVVALASLHGRRVVLTASKRTASAYRAVGPALQTRDDDALAGG